MRAGILITIDGKYKISSKLIFGIIQGLGFATWFWGLGLIRGFGFLHDFGVWGANFWFCGMILGFGVQGFVFLTRF